MSAVNTGKRTRSLGSNALENVVDEGVKDGHRLVGDTSIGVDLLKDYYKRMSFPRILLNLQDKLTLVDVRGVSLLTGLSPLLLGVVTRSSRL